MTSISRSALVLHSAANMYSLVRDIESYPRFLPWCANASVMEQSDTHQLATVSMDKRMKGLAFTTRNRLEADTAIHMGLVDGPFKKLAGVWSFTPIDENACKVELAIDFEFKSRVMAALLGGAFSKICDTMVAAFVKRADEIQAG
ncbi:MAG: type II toxin-antitoxin system RatA family toxin [Granulosicoccus sp.]